MKYRPILLTVFLVAGLALGQVPAKKDVASKEPAKPAAGSLEDTLEKSLRNSADIKAAESKVRDAESELNRVRQQVLTKATSLHTDLQVAKRMREVAEIAFAQTKEGNARGIVPQQELLAAQSAVEKARGEVEKLESQLKSLRGEFAIKNVGTRVFPLLGVQDYAVSVDGSIRLWDAAFTAVSSDPLGSGQILTNKTPPATVQPPMAERIRKLLDQEVEYETNNRVDQALEGLLEVAKSDIPLRILQVPDTEPLVALKGKMSVGAWLQAMEDTDPTIRILVRDYGILVTNKDRVPEGALRVLDFWRGNYAEIKKADPKPAEKK